MLTDKDMIFEVMSRNGINLFPVTPFKDAKETFTLGESPKLKGSVGFYTGHHLAFSFNEDGSLHNIGAW